MGLFKRIKEYRASKRRASYFATHKSIAEKYIDDNDLVIGSIYTGSHFSDRKEYTGILTEVSSSSDGIWAVIGNKEDIVASTLKLQPL